MGRNSLQTRMIWGITLALAAISLLIAGFSIYTTKSYFQDNTKQAAEDRYTGMLTTIETYKENAQSHAQILARNPQIIQSLKQRDAQTLFAITTPLLKESNLEYLVITDPKGFVIIRTHEPGKIPKPDDSIANQMNVAQAISGKSFVGVEEGKVVKLSVRAGVPVYDEQGTLIGAISTGYVISRNEIADAAKKMFGAEFTFYLGNNQVASTFLTADGQRMVGNNLDNPEILQAVLNEGKTFVTTDHKGEKTYTSAYGPLIGANGKIIGMIATEMPTDVMNEAINSLAFRIFIVSLFSLLLVIFGIICFARRLTEPLKIMLAEVQKVTTGNLTVSLEAVHSHDEIGKLASAFQVMVKSLREILRQVSASSQQLVSSSEQLAASAEQSSQAAAHVAEAITDVAQGTLTQLKAVDETTNIVTQMSASIEQVSTQAKGANDIAQKTSNAAQDGTKAIEKAISQMSYIENTVDKSARLVSGLGERSHEIGQIVNTIAGIADQTNLLALNAAVEAARAGEQGRGFGVVADEVRKLAEQSQEAAKQIASLISEIKSDTDKAVKAMSEGAQQVKTGTVVTQTAGQAFSEIVSLIEQVSEQVKKIANSIEQTASGSQKIVSSVEQIGHVSKKTADQSQTVSAATQEQSATQQEIASSSQELARLAEQLQAVISKYQF